MKDLVVFVDTTQARPKSLYVRLMKRLTWWSIGILATVAFIIFIYHPDWMLVPPKL